MKKNVLGSAAVVAFCVAAPSAQQQPAPTAQQRPVPISEATPAHNVFVLTGCLEAGAKPAETFKLTDASFIGQPTPGGRAAGAVGTSVQKLSYELRPVSGVDAQGLNADALKAHVGQRVEVIVRPIESPATAPTAGLAPAQSARPSEPAPERFTATEIKRVIGGCS